tara:strand:+ start:906 stop:1598 length:693 start_codon:yes stop_codon:yes gene_type:complete
MIRQDYIVRMIEKFAALIAQIVQRSSEGDLEDVRKLINQGTEEWVGLTIEEMREMSDSKLISRLLKGVSTAEGRNRCFMTVALLHQTARLHDRTNEQGEAVQCRLRALALLMTIRNFTEEEVVPDFVPKLALLLEELKGFELPAPVLAALMHHHELNGEFAKAEDRLFELLDRMEWEGRTIEFGHSFFHRLLGKSDEELVAGGLPKEEIESAIEELHKRGESAKSPANSR